MLEQGHLLPNLLDRESDRIDASQGSLIDNRVAPEPPLEGPMNRSEVEG